jgi:hypothetical protein
MNKTILGIIIGIVVIVAGVFFVTRKTIIAPTSVFPTPAATETVKTYTSEKLGIQFRYNSKPEANMSVDVKETGNVVYVYFGNVAPESGQSVQVFTKKSDETFETSIKRQFMAQYPSVSCKIEVSPSNIQSGYQVAEISYPKPTDVNQPWFDNAGLCNPYYDMTNGIRYFLYNPKFPDKFVFLSIGQYGILAQGNVPWQNTLIFTK